MPPSSQTDALRGSVDLLILKALTLGPTHGWGIGQRLQTISKDALSANQGSLYPALQRLEHLGHIRSEWADSENNRRARFYSITRAGRKQLAIEADLWSKTVAMMSRMLGESSS